MIFLLFHCRARSEELVPNDEFAQYRWVEETAVHDLELNSETKDMLKRMGGWEQVWAT